LIRVSALQGVLAANNDMHVLSRKVNDNFVLDLIESKGPPLVYATRAGRASAGDFWRQGLHCIRR